MAKPMMMMLLVEEALFGTVYRKIDGMPGVVSIQLNANNDKKPPAAPEGRKKGKTTDGTTSLCIVLTALNDALGSWTTREDLKTILVANGKAARSLDSIVYNAKKLKLIKIAKNTNALAITSTGINYMKTKCVIAK